MKKNMNFLFVIIVTFLINIGDIVAQKNDLFLMFYNVENFFDTLDDPDISDEEYTPEGRNEWNTEKYQKKISQLTRVFIAVRSGSLPDIIGLSEIENKSVIEDLFLSKPFKKGKYAVVHENSSDERGIDVALVYNKKRFKYLTHKVIKVNLPDNDKTRDILMVRGIVFKSDTLNIFVNHWPSRWGGVEKSAPFRELAAKALMHEVEKCFDQPIKNHVVIMGDFNDNPNDKSISEIIMEKKKGSEKLFNPYFDLFQDGKGSLSYKGNWDMFDQIIFSSVFNDQTKESGIFWNAEKSGIYNEKWMLYYSKEYDDYFPSRTLSGSKYFGGFSDHLPVYIMMHFKK